MAAWLFWLFRLRLLLKEMSCWLCVDSKPWSWVIGHIRKRIKVRRTGPVCVAEILFMFPFEILIGWCVVDCVGLFHHRQIRLGRSVISIWLVWLSAEAYKLFNRFEFFEGDSTASSLRWENRKLSIAFVRVSSFPVWKWTLKRGGIGRFAVVQALNILAALCMQVYTRTCLLIEAHSSKRDYSRASGSFLRMTDSLSKQHNANSILNELEWLFINDYVVWFQSLCHEIFTDGFQNFDDTRDNASNQVLLHIV